jgi:hypothetical protein
LVLLVGERDKRENISIPTKSKGIEDVIAAKILVFSHYCQVPTANDLSAIPQPEQ